jgi:hypothetical protein
VKARSSRLRDLLGGASAAASAARSITDDSGSERMDQSKSFRPSMSSADGVVVNGESSSSSSPWSFKSSPSPNSDPSGDAVTLAVVSDTESLGETLNEFTECWSTWAPPLLTKSVVAPSSESATDYRRRFLPVVDTNSGQCKYMDDSDWLKQVQEELEFEDEPWFEEFGEYEEWTTKPDGSRGGGGGVNGSEKEVFAVETAKELAETSQLTTSEQEERQTFVITAVIDPRNGDEISLDRAVSNGIINQRSGTYVNPWTMESMPIPTAMNAGKIKVEFTTTKKSVEKRSDVGLITIKMRKELRPFTVKGVIDTKTERKMNVDEAVKAGILNQKRNVYTNLSSGEQLSLADALDSGLLIVEFDNTHPKQTSDHAEIITKTYAVHAVSDVRAMRRVTFSEALAVGLIDESTAAYRNNATGESMDVGDAIRRGFIKATVVADPAAVGSAAGPCAVRLGVDLPGDAAGEANSLRGRLQHPVVKAVGASPRSIANDGSSAISAANGK